VPIVVVVASRCAHDRPPTLVRLKQAADGSWVITSSYSCTHRCTDVVLAPEKPGRIRTKLGALVPIEEATPAPARL
jgi:hypothetical protein